jgi:hypothetical protein
MGTQSRADPRNCGTSLDERRSLGSAVMTTVYFKLLPVHGQAHAVVVGLAVVAVVTILCLGLVRLLPRTGRHERETAGQDAEAVAILEGDSLMI